MGASASSLLGRARQGVRLAALYARLDALWIGQAKSSAITFYVSEWLVGIAVIVATWLLAERFDGIGPWSRGQVVFLLGYSLLVRGTVEMVFGWNTAFISRRIGRGQLDHMLLQPVPLALLLLTEGFSPLSGSALLISGVALLAWAGQGIGEAGALAFCLNWAASVGIVIAFSYAWGSLAFWAPHAAEEINSSTMDLVDQLRSFPLDGLGTGLLSILLSIVPVGFVAWWPSRALLEPGTSGSAGLWLTPLAALLLSLVSAGIFRAGLRHYRETGSVRYLSLGHRR